MLEVCYIITRYLSEINLKAAIVYTSTAAGDTKSGIPFHATNYAEMFVDVTTG
jgi:hypothetical protein